MADLPELTIVLGPQTRASLALNALVRENRQSLAAHGMMVSPSRIASPLVRRALDDRSEKERADEFEAKTKPRPAILSAINMLGPPQSGLKKSELFPDTEVTLAGLSRIAGRARMVLAIDPLPDFFLAAESPVLEERVRETPWEVLYEISWFELVREIVDVLPDADFLVLTTAGVGKDPMAVSERIFGDRTKDLSAPHVMVRQLISGTGNAVLDRMLTRGAPDAGTLAELYQSFATEPGKSELAERLGIDRLTGILLRQRFEEDVERIAALDRVEVI